MDNMLLAIDTTDPITNAKIEKLRTEQETTRAKLADAFIIMLTMRLIDDSCEC